MRKRFGQVEALRDADFSIGSREVVGLIGDNGAGKSTLVKILSGSIKPDSGELRWEGKPTELDSVASGRRLGIETVYQDLALAPDLDAAANLFLGREIRRSGFLGSIGFLDHAVMRDRAAETFSTLGVELPAATMRVRGLSGGQRQAVAVSRAVSWGSRIVVMDEPTAALGVVQTAKVLELVRSVRASGRSVIFVSHNMPDVLAVCDRIVVLRLGRTVGSFQAAGTSLEELVAAMTGALDPSPAGT
jgi:simple sugar transport system ATP-binding protein